MLRAQIGQCAVFKTPTKLQHPYCNSFEAIAIGKLDLVLDRRNVSLFRDLATEPIFTPRISQPLNTGSEYKNTNVFFILKYLKATICMHARRARPVLCTWPRGNQCTACARRSRAGFVNFRKFCPCIARARRAHVGLTVYPPSRTFELLAFDE